MEATNERGQKTLEFAERHKLVIANTLFKHKRSRLVSWHALNGRSYQIHFIIVTNKLKSCIQMKSSRNFPAADVESDHDLVMFTIIIPLFRHQSFTIPASLLHCSTITDPRFYCSNIRCSTVQPSLFHCSTISVPLFQHDFSSVPPSDALLFHHQMFHYYTIKSSTVSPSLFHCSIIKCSTVPPSHVLLFHHLRSVPP